MTHTRVKMTDLLTPDEVRNALARPNRWGLGLALEKRLCRDYLTLWDRNKELEALLPKRLIQRVGGTETDD